MLGLRSSSRAISLRCDPGYPSMYAYRFLRISVSRTFSGVTYLMPPARKKKPASSAMTVMMIAMVVVLIVTVPSVEAVVCPTAANMSKNRIKATIRLKCISFPSFSFIASLQWIDIALLFKNLTLPATRGCFCWVCQRFI